MRYITREDVDAFLARKDFASFEDPAHSYRKGVINRQRGYASFRPLGRTWGEVLERLRTEEESQAAVARLNEALDRWRA